MSQKSFTIGQIFHQAFARYLCLRPQGLEFPDGQVSQQIEALLHRQRPSRTLYKNKKPMCRSLDGINPLSGDLGPCACCRLKIQCTPQMLLELTVDQTPYYLLLSYTSLKNFMTFSRPDISEEHRPPPRLLLTVRDRGRWGELTFKRL